MNKFGYNLSIISNSVYQTNENTVQDIKSNEIKMLF